MVWSGLKTWKKYNVVDEEYYKLGEIATQSYTSLWRSGWIYWLVEYPSGKKIKEVVSDGTGNNFNEGDFLVRDYVYNGRRQINCFKIKSCNATQRYYAYSVTISLATRKAKGTFIEDVEAEEGTYPANGRHSDGYWYELVK